jgi:hypothetical protein
MLGSDDYLPDPRLGGLYTKPKIGRQVVVRDAAGRILYAVIGLHGTIARPRYEGPTYFSAMSQEDAIAKFRAKNWHLQFSFILGAPAIGFFVHDNHGDKLSAGGSRGPADLDRHP